MRGRLAGGGFATGGSSAAVYGPMTVAVAPGWVVANVFAGLNGAPANGRRSVFSSSIATNASLLTEAWMLFENFLVAHFAPGASESDATFELPCSISEEYHERPYTSSDATVDWNVSFIAEDHRGETASATEPNLRARQHGGQGPGLGECLGERVRAAGRRPVLDLY